MAIKTKIYNLENNYYYVQTYILKPEFNLTRLRLINFTLGLYAVLRLKLSVFTRINCIVISYQVGIS